MYNALTSLNPLAVIVVSIIGFAIGAIWYSPALFSKAWMAEMKLTPEQAQAASKGRIPLMMGGGFMCTVVSTLTLAVLIAANRTSAPVKGAELGLLVGAGLVAARQATNAIFEMRSLRHFLIVAGHDVAMCTVLGAILAVWR
jgi:hypothetical protein